MLCYRHMVHHIISTVYTHSFNNLLQGDESHKADEYIRFVKDRLPEAVLQCIKAAGEEFQPAIQQSLLKVMENSSLTVACFLELHVCTVLLSLGEHAQQGIL